MSDLTETQKEQSRRISHMIRSSSPNLQTSWEAFIRDVYTGGVTLDIAALVQLVIREAYMEDMQDLQFYANKLKYYNKSKKQIRDQINQMRDHIIELEKVYSSLESDAQESDSDFQTAVIQMEKALMTSPDVSIKLHKTAKIVLDEENDR